MESVKQQLRDMHSSAESSQAKLLDASQRQEQDVAARLAELDMVAADLTRANERVATVERRNVSYQILSQSRIRQADLVGVASRRDGKRPIRLTAG